VSELDEAVRAHARRIVARDAGARTDLALDAQLEPDDLFDRLLSGEFWAFEVVAHARIGEYHLFKTRYRGSTILVVQARWVQDPDGRWRIHEAELARVAAGDES